MGDLMSRSDRIMNRIEEALRGVRVETSEIYCQDVKESNFGLVNVVLFLWKVAEDELNADVIAREISGKMAEKHICVFFHKTRRQSGERLLVAAQAFNPSHNNYSYFALAEFTRNWLIEVTQANKSKPGSNKKNDDRLQFRM